MNSYLVKLKNIILDDYIGKYMKIKLNRDGDSPFEKT